jgi:hypothetical protein
MGRTNKIPRRWCQFSLRSLLLLVLAVSLSMGLLVVPIDRAHRQRAAIDALRRAGWEVHCEDTGAGPAWAKRILAHGFFAEAVRAHSRRAVTDEELVHLRRLPRLRALIISGRGVTDDGMIHVGELHELTSLYLCTTEVGDEGLSPLGRLTELRGLYLTSTQVTDVGLGHLAQLGNLKELHLYRTHVTDEGVRQLQAALPECKIWY